MKLVGATLGIENDDASIGAAELRGEAVAEHLDFVDQFDRRVCVHLADAEAHVLAAGTVNPEHLALGTSTGE